MSHTTLRYLYCDGGECQGQNDPFSNSPRPGETITEQREQAREEGWLVSQSGGKDYCPDCRQALNNKADAQ